MIVKAYGVEYRAPYQSVVNNEGAGLGVPLVLDGLADCAAVCAHRSGFLPVKKRYVPILAEEGIYLY